MIKSIAKMMFMALVLTVFLQNVKAQADDSDQKAQLVNDLVKSTFEAFPMGIFEGIVEKMKTESLGGFRNEISKMMTSKVDETAEFSVEKKADIKNKIPALVDKMAIRLEVLVTQDMDMSQWIKESLADSYTKELTVDELKKLTSFFNSPSGKAFFEVVKEEAAAQGENRPANSDGILKNKDAVEIEKFMKTPVAQKFMANFVKGSDTYLEAKIESWGETMLKNIEAEMETGEIGKLLKDFMETNFN